MKGVLVSGASGFVGQALCPLLEEAGWTVRKASRNRCPGHVEIGDIGTDTDWQGALAGMSAVVHLAARVHVMRDTANDPLAAFRLANRDATAHLARQAAASGVKRFIYLSSIKVNGEATDSRPFHPDDPAHPQDAYAQSKWEAECQLHDIAASTGLEVTILRPPLVYGPHVKANFLRLLHWVEQGIPLPLASLENRRSLLYVGNLADAIRCCLEHPAAAGQTFLPCDGAALSTPQLIRLIAAAFGRTPRLVRFPEHLLRLAGRLTGKGEEIRRLCESLEIADSGLESRLAWRAPYTVEQGLATTVAWLHEATR